MPAIKVEGGHFSVLLGREPVAVLSPCYLSLTIDISLVLGGHWWGRGKGVSRGVAIDTVTPINLSDPRLLAFAKLLAPSMVRIGGTEADCVRYQVGEKNPRRQKAKVRPIGKHDREMVLEESLWKRINAFASSAGFEILFVVNAGPGQRDAEGAWTDSGARALIVHFASTRTDAGVSGFDGYSVVAGSVAARNDGAGKVFVVRLPVIVGEVLLAAVDGGSVACEGEDPGNGVVAIVIVESRHSVHVVAGRQG